MKKTIFTIAMCCLSLMVMKAQKTVIRIATEANDLLLQVGDNGRLYQTYFGQRLKHDADL